MAKKVQVDSATEASVKKQPLAKRLWQVVTSHTVQMFILVVYYMILLIVSYWSIFDIWSEHFAVLTWLGVSVEDMKHHDLLYPISYTIIGGILGSLLYNIRQLFRHYCGKDTDYDSHWFGKYISGPWEGGVLALIVLAIIRGGVAVFGGSFPPPVEEPVASFAAFSTGALVGFGMRDVVGWIGGIVATMFPNVSQIQIDQKEEQMKDTA